MRFILLCLLLAAHVASDCQQKDFCINGGSCLLANERVATKRCGSDEVFYEGSCFSNTLKLVSWTEAAQRCAARDAQLPVPQNADQQKFLSIYTQRLFDSSGVQDVATEGIWTGVRSVANGTSPAWVSYPGSLLVNQMFWQPGEPNLYPNWNDVCVSTRRESLFLEWHSQSCENTNFVVCQRILPPNGDKAVPQCSCPSGYSGERCEQSQSSAGNCASCPTQKTLCEGQPLLFSCQNSQTITVDYALYGSSGTSCAANSTAVLNCYNENTLKTIQNMCDGQPFCQIDNIDALFPETPCPTGSKFQLQYRMRCSSDPKTTCAQGSVYQGGKCFAFHIDPKKGSTKEEADNYCKNQGGQLPTGLTSSTTTEIAQQLARRGGDLEIWLGMTVNAGNRTWEGGQAVSYSPSGSDWSGSGNCAVMKTSTDGSFTWKSFDCGATADFICQTAPTSSSDSSRPEQKVPQSQPSDGRVVFKGDGRNDAVEDIFGNKQYCKEDTARGVRFPKTRACAEASVACPDPENVVGTIVRYCNCRTAKWDSPNTSNCTHKWVAEVRASLERGDPAEFVTNELSQQLSTTLDQSSLFGGDIVGSVQLSSDSLNLARGQYSQLTDRYDRQARASNFTQALGQSGDYLLAPISISVWDELDQWKRIDHASNLMSTLEQSTLLLAQYSLDGDNGISFQNWAMEYQVNQPDTYIDSRTRIAMAPMDDPSIAIMNPSLDAPSSNVTFNSINKSPIISLPSVSVLKESSSESLGSPVGAITGQAFFSPEGGADTNLDRSRLLLGYYVFTTFSSILAPDQHSIINSHVIGASVDNATESVRLPDNQPATFTFYHLQKTGVSNPRCVFWDLNLKQWSVDGCILLSTGKDSSQCACNHLTSFAILMDVSGRVGRYSGTLASALDVVSTVGCAISIVCLALSFGVFSFFPSLHNVRNTIHRNLCFCLLVAELTFVIGVDRTSNPTGCAVVALFLHFFFLAAFTWMLLEGYQLYLMLIQVFEPSKRRMLMYYCFCYGFPAIVVAVSAGVAWDDYGTDTYCWIDTSSPTIWAFVGPICAVIAINIIFLAIALRVVLSVKTRDRTKMNRIIGWLKGSATLLCLLGITWVFGFLTAVKGGTGTAFAWIFTILNCTQGIFIFVLHVVMNDKVRQVVVRFIRTGVLSNAEAASAYNSKDYLSSRQRIMNMVRTSGMPSAPSTVSTDDKEPQMTPTSKTSDWLQKHVEYDCSSSIDEQTSSSSSDPRGSQIIEPRADFEKHAAVKRKKFPLGITEDERRESAQNVQRL